MNIRDLMVGDFVHSKLHDVDTFVIDIEGRVPKDQPELEYTEAVSVWLDSRQCWERHYLDEIEPIPLTKEILEKNGLKMFDFRGIEGQHRWSWWRDMQTSVTFWCRELNDDPRDGWMVRIDSSPATYCNRVEYVHELQHAMNICGIDSCISKPRRSD